MTPIHVAQVEGAEHEIDAMNGGPVQPHVLGGRNHQGGSMPCLKRPCLQWITHSERARSWQNPKILLKNGNRERL